MNNMNVIKTNILSGFNFQTQQEENNAILENTKDSMGENQIEIITSEIEANNSIGEPENSNEISSESNKQQLGNNKCRIPVAGYSGHVGRREVQPSICKGNFEYTSDTESIIGPSIHSTKRKRSVSGESNVLRRHANPTTNGEKISIEDFIQKIKSGFIKERIVHDIVDTRDDSKHNFTVQKLRELTARDGFLIAIEHSLNNFDHQQLNR